MIKAVIFDLDGLLINSEVISHQIIQGLTQPYGHNVDLVDYAEHYSGRSEVANISDVIARFSLPYDLENGIEMCHKIEETLLEKGVDLKPGAKELLKYLKNNQYRIALATSSLKERAFRILSQHDLIDYFDVFVFGSEIENGKPHPDIFIKACTKLGEQPHDCLVLEDSEAGVQSAIRAHIPVICIPDLKPPFASTLEKTVCVYSDLFQVIDYLKKA